MACRLAYRVRIRPLRPVPLSSNTTDFMAVLGLVAEPGAGRFHGTERPCPAAATARTRPGIVHEGVYRGHAFGTPVPTTTMDSLC